MYYFFVQQRHWQLFVENKDRNANPFPYNSEEGSISSLEKSMWYHGVGREFVKAIAICVLAQRETTTESPIVISQQSLSQATDGK